MGAMLPVRVFLIGAAILVLSEAGAAVAEARQARVALDGVVQRFDVPAYAEEGTFYLPVRALLEQLNYSLEWDTSESRIIASKDGLMRMELKPDSSGVIYNSSHADLGDHVRLINGTAYMPAEPVMKLLGYEVETDSYHGSIYLKTPIWLRIGEALAAGGDRVRLVGETAGFGAVTDVSLYLEDELVYEGSWKYGAMIGGKVYDKGRLMYEGGIKYNRPEGFGIRYDVSGSRYEGQFREGIANGKGRWFSGGKLVYDGEWASGRMEGNGKLYGSAGKAVYQGALSNGLRQGYGILYNDAGGKAYEGNWAAGERSGFGKAFSADGKIEYAGMWRNDVRHGQGSLNRFGRIKYYDLDGTSVTSVKDLDVQYVKDVEYANGLLIVQGSREWIYSGAFTDTGEPEGEGEVGIVTGTTLSEAGVLTSWSRHYKGTLKDGRMTGNGVLYDAQSKVSYEGEVKDGKRNGQGASFQDSVIQYNGGWRDDAPHGLGWTYKSNSAGSAAASSSDYNITEVTYSFGKQTKTGNVYRVYRDSTGTGLTGNGVQIWIYDGARGAAPLGDEYWTSTGGGVLVYSGSLRNGLREGQGTEYLPEGFRYTGSFKANRKSGMGKLELPGTGYRFEGEFADNDKNGKGKLYSGGSLLFEGEYKSGLRNGYGVSYVSGMKEYEGNYQDDKRHGYGVSYLNGAKHYAGQFKNDKRDGFGTLYRSTGEIEYSGEFKEGYTLASYNTMNP
jgi:hypothetical protein